MSDQETIAGSVINQEINNPTMKEQWTLFKTKKEMNISIVKIDRTGWCAYCHNSIAKLTNAMVIKEPLNPGRTRKNFSNYSNDSMNTIYLHISCVNSFATNLEEIRNLKIAEKLVN